MITRPLVVSDAAFWGEFVEVAYMMYQSDRNNPNPPQPSYFPAGWNLYANITIDPSVLGDSQVQFIGFITQSAADPTSFGIVFRGTEGDLDWIMDFEFWMDPFTEIPNGGNVEHGFLALYQTLKGILQAGGATGGLEDIVAGLAPTPNVVVTGHSLGGALAILLATVLSSTGTVASPTLYTLAAPMVGDLQFASTFNARVPDSVRIYNLPDLVPDLPGTLLGYSQVQTGFAVNSLLHPNIVWSPTCFHSLLVYLYLLGSTKYGLNSCATSLRPARSLVFAGAPATPA
jgi:triacylglycerol lipase